MKAQWKQWLICAALPALLMTESLHAQGQILFLRLRMQNDSVRLVESSLRPGMVKQVRKAPESGVIEYECLTHAGEVVFRGRMSDPSLRRYEYEDPAEPGRIAVRHVRVKDAEFTVRVPYREGLRRVDFYRKNSNASSGASVRSMRTHIGTVDVQSLRGTP
ncbi:MAG: hypothetical protein ACM3Q4_02605 [Acidobacteriota bacterium]